MYDLEKTWDTGLRLRLQRRSAYLHRLVFVAGGVFMVAAVVLFFLGARPLAAITPFGSGLALVAGACFLLEFFRGRPAAFSFDHTARQLIVEERDGSSMRLSYDRFHELRMRRQGRRWIVYLAGFDGSYWDLSAYGGRRPALDLIARLNDRLPLDSKNKTSRRNPGDAALAAGDAYNAGEGRGREPGYRRGGTAGQTYFWWRDKLTPRGTLYILGLLAGFCLVAGGLAADLLRSPLNLQIALGAFGLLALFLVISALRGLGRVQVISVDQTNLTSGTGRDGASVPRYSPGKTVARSAMIGIWHSFDLQAGLQRFLLVDEEARATLASLYTDDKADFSAAWRAVGARFRTPQLSLPGLAVADVVLLREELQALLFENGNP